ncbi:MAG: hypothetical protein D6780_07915, partial [Candidatus Dadabacteria bacterium]
MKKILTLCLIGSYLSFLFNNTVFGEDPYLKSNSSKVSKKDIKQKSYYRFKGKTIKEIEIEIRPIFDPPPNWLYRTANRLKVPTRKSTVKQELLFKEGDDFDPFAFAETERLLRTLPFLRDIQMSVKPINEKEVKVIVSVQQTWTLIPQVSLSTEGGRRKVEGGLEESDLLGFGNRLEVLYKEEDNRTSIETVYDDRRIWGSNIDLLAAYFDRDDGERTIVSFGRPFRSLIDQESWKVNLDYSDFIGRLFKNGDERFIYRSKRTDTGIRYTISRGNPEINTRRY